MSFLDDYKRQPKLYIDLPSSGRFYDDTVFEDNQYVQMPVYAMTAADEIVSKTPDALFSGKAVALILQSCIPLLKDPWKLIKSDLEYLLTAIRIASSGNTIDMKSTCSVCKTENTVELDLQSVLQHYDNFHPEASFTYKDLTINLQPITFKEMSELGIALYQRQRTVYQLQRSDLSDEELQKQAATIADEVVLMTSRSLTSYIASISKGDEFEKDMNKINNFIEGNDGEISKMFLAEITKFVNLATFPPVKIQCAGDIDAEPCTNVYEIEYNGDFSSFFVKS